MPQLLIVYKFQKARPVKAKNRWHGLNGSKRVKWPKRFTSPNCSQAYIWTTERGLVSGLVWLNPAGLVGLFKTLA